jgi:hypothetical protein
VVVVWQRKKSIRGNMNSVKPTPKVGMCCNRFTLEYGVR